MGGAPFGLAVAAGMLASVNPCGFALLPAYLSFLVAGDGPTVRRTAVGRALVASAAMTAGFAAVFGVFGLAVVPVAGQVQRHLPWLTVGVGAALVAAGGWLLAGRTLPGLRLPTATGPAVTRTVMSMATFGAAYAAASLSCTIGPFLAIVVTSFRAGSLAAGVGLFLAYAAGMGLPVTAAALAAALAQGALLARLRAAAPLVSFLAGLLLVVAGSYVAYYGWWETRVLARGPIADPVVDAAAAVQRWLADMLDRAGPAVVAVAVALLLAVGIGTAWRHRRRGRGKSTVDR
jgi:cytochrome c-type biogenesis protein